ncbi:MAG: kelch repeat-containing protein [Dehalococcoidia bacterium]
MNDSRLTRRMFLRRAAAGGTGLVGLYLVGCGDGDSPAPSPTAPGAATATAAPTPERPLVWRDITPSGIQPPARRDHSLVTDGERLYLFGGRNDGGDLPDLWAFDLASQSWSELAPTGPSPRHGHNAVWTPDSRMIVFGGQAGGGFFNDLWAFDPAASAWAELPGSGGGPEPRYGAGGSFDPEGRFLVTHGFTANGRFDDTWSYDLAGGAWSDISPADERPVERCLMRTVWDTLQARILIFGGQTNGTPFLDDLWSLQPGSTRGWARLERDPKPAPRAFYSMVFDGEANKMIIFGGNTQAGPANDLWFFDAKSEFWTSVVPGGLPPSPRQGHDAVWLPGRSSLVVFGGNSSDGDLNDLWELARAQ